jgi:hypothetical protein
VHQHVFGTIRRLAQSRLRSPRIQGLGSLAGVIGCAVLMFIVAAPAVRAADPQPSAAMMEPIQGLVTFMSTLRRGEQPTVFARRGPCIIENFAPYVFCGLQAAANWSAGFRAHAAKDDLKELAATFGEAHDFSQSGSRVYFSLPTTWTGLTHSKHFEEHGSWSFVLDQETAGWRIVGYGWGVSAYSETPQ